ncbi:hypothetical protein LguiB_004259 [Lonicera macranthoides]
MDSVTQKPHAICIPYPSQSHIKAMLKQAKLLHSQGIQITFVNTEYNHNRFLKSSGPDSLAGLPACRIFNLRLSPMIPPATCIVSDGFMTFTIDAGEKLGIPVVLVWTIAACAFMGFFQCHDLMEKGFTPLKDVSYLTNGYLDTVIDWIPGMKGIRLKDIPSVIRTTDPNDILFNYTMESAMRSSKASANVIHTFKELEADIVSSLSTMIPQVYTIGPLQLLLNQVLKEEHRNLTSIGYSLWKEEPLCFKWLDTREPSSVLYVNFGSIAVMSSEKLVEFALGLANSGQDFLWIIRPDLVMGESAILPLEFQEVTKERGFIAGWCPQEQVLSHQSVGGFLTHCGWNSTIESLSAGVPMICLPFMGDQPTNCRYTCTEWEVGLEIDVDFKKDDVEKVARELMEGEKGKRLKNKAMEWKKEAEKATGAHGSSFLNLDMTGIDLPGQVAGIKHFLFIFIIAFYLLYIGLDGEQDSREQDSTQNLANVPKSKASHSQQQLKAKRLHQNS